MPSNVSLNIHGVSVGSRVLAIALAGLLGTAGCGITAKNASSGGEQPSLTSPQLSASTTSVSFGSVAVGTSTAQLVTLTDTGDSNISISKVSATGTGFSASGGSNVTLTSGQAVTVSVNFEPAASGGATGSLSVSSNASDSLLQIGLAGTGVVQTVQHTVALDWDPSTSQVIGYFVYRGSNAAGPFSKLNPSVDPSAAYADGTVVSGQTYFYAVTSVSSSNVESAYSNLATVTIPTP